MFSPREAGLERGWPGRIEGDRVVQLAAQTLQSFFTGGGKAREHAEYRLEDVVLRAPVLHPPSVRVFEGDEFQFSNPAAIYGPDDEIPYPEGSRRLDYGFGFAAIVGADETIGGYTSVNDWTANDLAPAKDKDFATSLGPVVVTSDELRDLPPETIERVNGHVVARGRRPDLEQGFEAIARLAARNTRLLAGDVLVLGGRGNGSPLLPGDLVELEALGIGVLRNRIGPTSA